MINGCLNTVSIDVELGCLSAKIIWDERHMAGVDCAGVQERLTPDGCSDWAGVRESSSGFAWFMPQVPHHAARAAVSQCPHPAQTQAAAILL